MIKDTHTLLNTGSLTAVVAGWMTHIPEVLLVTATLFTAVYQGMMIYSWIQKQRGK